MSQQGPLVIVSNREGQALAGAIAQVKAFPLLDSGWSEAIDALTRLRPAAVIATDLDGQTDILANLADRAARIDPYVPLIALDPGVDHGRIVRQHHMEAHVVQVIECIGCGNPDSSSYEQISRTLQDVRFCPRLWVVGLKVTVLVEEVWQEVASFRPLPPLEGANATLTEGNLHELPRQLTMPESLAHRS